MQSRTLSNLYESTIDYLKQHGVSNLTDSYLQDRYNNGLSSIELNSATLDSKKNFLELVFWAEATYGNTSFIAFADLPQPPNGYYTLALRFYGVNSFLNPSSIKNGKYSDIESSLRKIVHSCDVRYYSDDPSFYFQGSFEGLDKHDLSIYKFTGEKGDGIWDARHAASGGLSNSEIHLTKHLAQVSYEIDDYIRDIAQKLEIR